MKLLMCMIFACMVASAVAGEKGKKDSNDPIAKMWQEMLDEKKEYGKMKKDGASAEELKLQETLIKELYKTVVAMKKDKYGDKVEKKEEGPIVDAWQKVLEAKKEYGAMEKNGASDEELGEQKELIEKLYAEVVAMKKAKYGDKK